jgi:NAD(P)-dependent dehydrogenase (short-subunit alcohol dehydrogenase family)
MNLNDQVAIVTGGGGGLGEGICLCFARAGADVVVSDVKEDLAQNVAAKVKELGRKAIAVSTDVRDEAECRRLVDRTLEEMGRLDILVCSAGTAAYGPGNLVGCELGDVAYEKVVEALGGYGERVERVDQIRPALERAFASKKPACLNVYTDRDVPGPTSGMLANLGKE